MKAVNIFALSAIALILANNLHFVVNGNLIPTILDYTGYALFLWGSMKMAQG